MRFAVYSTTGRALDWLISKGEKERLIKKRQAVQIGKRGVRLTGVGERWSSATHVSRPGPLAAAGLSQKYTLEDAHHNTTGFKRIAFEDRGYFSAAWRNDFDL